MVKNKYNPKFVEEMSKKIDSNLIHAWNAFEEKETYTPLSNPGLYDMSRYGGSLVNSSYMHPDHRSYSYNVDKTIAVAIYNRIVTDCADVHIHHVRTDENGLFKEEMSSGLNEILTTEANIDQSGTAFMSDLIMSMLDEGYVAAVPIDTSINPETGSYDIYSMRTGKIKTWYPDRVRLEVYNDRIGKRKEIILPKRNVAIIENPFYSVMNEKFNVAEVVA